MHTQNLSLTYFSSAWCFMMFEWKVCWRFDRYDVSVRLPSVQNTGFGFSAASTSILVTDTPKDRNERPCRNHWYRYQRLESLSFVPMRCFRLYLENDSRRRQEEQVPRRSANPKTVCQLGYWTQCRLLERSCLVHSYNVHEELRGFGSLSSSNFGDKHVLEQSEIYSTSLIFIPLIIKAIIVVAATVSADSETQCLADLFYLHELVRLEK